MTARERAGHLLFALLAIVGAVVLGETYVGRLPNHAGYWLVRVEDEVAAPAKERPRRLVVVVVDGLRRDAAEGMKSTRRLLAHGQCRVSDQGSYTVSRPVYSLLSTGLEADRTGSRNNDLTAPLAAQSFWEVARAHGLRVRASSHLPWWGELFPRGFDAYRHLPLHEENVFAGAREDDARFDVDLFHPLYVDEAGHEHGAKSAAYAAAVARADAELLGLLERVDLERDVVVLTADHGHRAEGGHGGELPELREVLACFAGPRVLRRDDRLPLDGRLTAPLLSLLAGVPFPAHMRAGEDHLDDLAGVVALDPAFTADRRAAIARFRRANEEKLTEWLGGAPGTWSRLYAREARAQQLRGGAVALVALAFLAARLRRRPRDLVFLAGLALAFGLVHHAILGDFDYTVINRKMIYVRKAFAAAGLALALGLALHRALRGGRLPTRLADALALALLASAGHVFVYGWPLGFPLPSQAARYLPFFLPFVEVALGLALAVAAVPLSRLRRRAQG